MKSFVEQCLCIPGVHLGFVIAGLFVGVALVHYLLFHFLKKGIQSDGLARKMILSIRYPSFFLLLVIVAIISSIVIEMSEDLEEAVHLTLVSLLIATIGWLLIGIAGAIFRYLSPKYRTEALEDVKSRGVVTQIHFFYRLFCVLVVLLSAAAILLNFPMVKSLGVGIIGSAGIVGIALGIAARPLLTNLIAGTQIALTKLIKIGDGVFLEGDFGRVEHIYLTHVVVKTWDMRRIIMPVSYFIEKPFQNWSAHSSELLGSVFLYCDYSVPVGIIREKFLELVKAHPGWNGKSAKLHVTDMNEKTLQMRLIMTAKDAGTAFELRASVREDLLAFIHENYPNALPRLRVEQASL